MKERPLTGRGDGALRLINLRAQAAISSLVTTVALIE
jgi:hypothetical protein